VALIVSTVALVLLASWLMELRMRASRLSDEIAELRRSVLVREGEVA
jgi:hypothetical protein